MSLNRLIFLGLIAAYTFWINPSVPREALISASVFAVISFGIVAHILVRPNQSTVRRLVGIVSDLATASFQLHYVGETSSVLFLLYLWITFGNGFRFGVRFLYVAMAVSVACFTAVIYTTPRWHDDPYLSASLLLSLVVLPLYASTLIRKLSNAKAQAEAANRSKTLFLASVSHELRTPLNAIIGFSSLIAGTNLDAEQRGIVRTIGSAGEALLRQINSILTLSRIEAGKLPVDHIDFDLSDVLSTARAMVLTQALQKGLRLTLHIAPQAPLQLHGPKHHLEEILLNLLGNAVKFTEKGHVTLVAHPVTLNGADAIRFMVSDTGIGIAPQAIEKIFESFTQADETIINRFGGTGLGLSICRQLIETMGGRLGVDSQEGHGSSFWFVLPMKTAEKESERARLPHRLQSLVVCANSKARDEIAGRLGGADRPVFADLAAAHAWAQSHDHPQPLVYYYSDLPEDRLAAEIEGARLPVPPILIRPNLPQDYAASGLLNVSCSILPLEFTPEEARTAAIAMVAQTSWAQSMWEEPAKGKIPKAARPLSILVADDNATNRLVISKILERGGHSARCVANGEEALNALEAEAFDLVIMDVNMPVMTGIEAAKLYRFTEPHGVHIPIIALTADVTSEVSTQTTDAGMDACLSKPIQPMVLIGAIEELAGSPRDHTGPARDEVSAPSSREPASTIDMSLIAELEQLGGKDFVRDLVAEFFSDTDRLIEELRDAAASGDSSRFRLEAHGLQSASANVGAKAVHEICVGWRKITSAELLQGGATQVDRLARELDRTFDALQRHLTDERTSAFTLGAAAPR